MWLIGLGAKSESAQQSPVRCDCHTVGPVHPGRLKGPYSPSVDVIPLC